MTTLSFLMLSPCLPCGEAGHYVATLSRAGRAGQRTPRRWGTGALAMEEDTPWDSNGLGVARRACAAIPISRSGFSERPEPDRPLQHSPCDRVSALAARLKVSPPDAGIALPPGGLRMYARGLAIVGRSCCGWVPHPSTPPSSDVRSLHRELDRLASTLAGSRRLTSVLFAGPCPPPVPRLFVP